MAFIMKLYQGMTTRPEALWVKCLKAKYKCGESPIPEVRKFRNASLTWQSISDV